MQAAKYFKIFFISKPLNTIREGWVNTINQWSNIGDVDFRRLLKISTLILISSLVLIFTSTEDTIPYDLGFLIFIFGGFLLAALWTGYLVVKISSSLITFVKKNYKSLTPFRIKIKILYWLYQLKDILSDYENRIYRYYCAVMVYIIFRNNAKEIMKLSQKVKLHNYKTRFNYSKNLVDYIDSLPEQLILVIKQSKMMKKYLRAKRDLLYCEEKMEKILKKIS